VNQAALHQLCDLAGRHGITVAWLLPPTRPDWHARRVSIGVVATVDRFVAEVLARHPNLVVLDARDSNFPAEVFRDPTHLDGLGAVALSESIAEALQPILDGPPKKSSPGLVALRPFEPPAGPIPLEDLARSAELSTRRR
jgi:hypothetical protein